MPATTPEGHTRQDRHGFDPAVPGTPIPRNPIPGTPGHPSEVAA